MSLELMVKYYDKLQKAYMDCIKNAVATALFEAWGENWYSILKQKDKEVTDETNKKREESAKKKGKDPSRVPYITDKFETILKFDFQACNKLLYYMDEVRGIVYKEYGKSDIFEDKSKDKNYRNYFNELIEFRNAFEGHKAHENESPTQEEFESQAKSISNMRTILKDVLCDVVNAKDIAKRTYFLSFEDYRTAYERELLKKPYLLDKYLDCNKYDVDGFYEACQDLGIEGRKIEGKDVFYSANLDEDLKKLKNALSFEATHKTANNTPVVQNTEQNVKQKSKTSVKTVFVIVLIMILFVIIAFLLGKMLSDEGDTSKGNSDSNNTSVNSLSSVQTNNNTNDILQLPLDEVEINESSLPQISANSSKNELTEEYNQDVEAFKYLDKSQRNLRTLKIKVGEKITPQAAAVWSDCEIFSQNTNIAKAQGIVIEGISKGETYVVVEAATGMSQVFMVVVG